MENTATDTTTTTEQNFKYANHEEAEKAYKNAESLIGQKESKIKEIEEQKNKEIENLKAAYAAPETYTLDSSIEVSETVKKNLDEVAKASGLTQKQYNEMAKTLAVEASNIESARAKRNEEIKSQLNAIPDYLNKKEKLEIYVDQNYSAALVPVIKENMANPTFFNKMWEERENKTSTKGMPENGTTVDKPFDEEQLTDVRRKMIQNPHKLEYKNEYLRLLKVKAEKRKIS